VAARLPRRIPKAVAATLVLLAGGILAGCGGGHPHTAVPASATTRPPASPPTTQPPRGPYVWTRDASPALDVGGGASTTIAAVQTPGSGRQWLVAGTRTSTAGSTTATVWRSPNGGGWSAEPLTGPAADSQAEAATTWEGRTVVVGSVGRGSARSAAVWVARAPGAAFEEVPPSDLPLGAETLTTVASGALGLFATGQANGGVAVWYSSNGSRWTRLQAAERVINGASAPHISTLTVASDGVYAAGWESDGSRIDAAVWTSADGVNWHPVLTAEAAFAGGGDRMITGLVPVGTGNVPTGFVAVGGVRLGTHWEPASWISPNGASWSEPSHAFARAPRPQGDEGDVIVRGMSIATDGPESATFVAVGGSATAQRLWYSSDGVRWTELRLPSGAARSDGWSATLVSSNGAAIVVASGVAGQPHVMIDTGKAWVEPSAQPSVFGSVRASALPVGEAAGSAGLVLAVQVVRHPQVVDSGEGNKASLEFLASSNGTTWRSRPAGPAFAGATVRGITWVKGSSSRGRFVAVGARTVGGRPRAAAWVSDDGIAWTPASLLDQTPLEHRALPVSVADGACVRGSVIVAVGNAITPGSTAARAWASVDGVHWRAARMASVPRHAGSYEMAGCAATGSGFAAYGSGRVAGTGGTTGRASPTTWEGTASGAAWAQQANDAFSDLPAPLVGLSGSARNWLALVAGDSVPSASAGVDSSAVLYASTDNGSTWQPLDTTTGPWAGAGLPQLDEVTWSATTPLVAGEVDGRLVVWSGTATG
jgi:hypothetical protein